MEKFNHSPINLKRFTSSITDNNSIAGPSLNLSENVLKARIAERNYERLIQLSNLDGFDSDMSIQLMESMIEFIEEFKGDSTNIMLGEKSACEAIIRLMNQYIDDSNVVKSAAKLVTLLARKNCQRFIDSGALHVFMKAAARLKDDQLLVIACSHASATLSSIDMQSEVKIVCDELWLFPYACRELLENSSFQDATNHCFPKIYVDWLQEPWKIIAKQPATNKEGFYCLVNIVHKLIAVMFYMDDPSIQCFLKSLIDPVDPFSHFLLACWDDRKKCPNILLASCKIVWSVAWVGITPSIRESALIVLGKAVEEENGICKQVFEVGLNYLIYSGGLRDLDDFQLRVACLCRNIWNKWKSDPELVRLTFLVQYIWEIYGKKSILNAKMSDFYDCDQVIRVLQFTTSDDVKKNNIINIHRVLCDVVQMFAEANPQYRQKLIDADAVKCIRLLGFADAKLKEKTLQALGITPRENCTCN